MFKTFPEFSKLTLANRRAYESLVSDYPPICSISFPSLMLWWNFFDSLAVATLNKNLIISYWRPGEDDRSGLSVIGTEDVDATICAVFDELRNRGDKPRLVHVPEFVISHIQYPELFAFHAERTHDEYVLDVSKFYPLEAVTAYRRSKIKKALRIVEGKKIEVKSIDLDSVINQALLLNAAEKWWRKGTINDFGKTEREVMGSTVVRATELGIQNACLYVDGELTGFCLYHTHGSNAGSAIFDHMRVDYSTPGGLDLVSHILAGWFADKGFKEVNLDDDLGIPRLRIQKLVLGPSNYFRKYTIEPA